MDNERIATLETQMEEVIGNGQPGRLGKLETRVEGHSKLIYMGIGGLYVLHILVAIATEMLRK